MSSNTCAICKFWQSSIGKKIVVAVTGLFLVLFLAGHLAGNMLIFQSSDAFNHYAHFLHTMIHGWGIWVFRIMMLGAVVLHVLATIQLTCANRAARPEGYKAEGTMVASRSSRMMIWSGITVLAFIIFHILHYTVRVDAGLANLADFHQNWAMTILGFQNIFAVIFYIIGMALLCSHLSHGVASIFQTLGLRSRKTQGLIATGSKIYALVIFIGFVSIPISIKFFGLGKEEMTKTIEAVKTLEEKGYTHLPEELIGQNLTEEDLDGFSIANDAPHQ